MQYVVHKCNEYVLKIDISKRVLLVRKQDNGKNMALIYSEYFKFTSDADVRVKENEPLYLKISSSFLERER